MNRHFAPRTSGIAIRCFALDTVDGSIETAEDTVHDCSVGLSRSPGGFDSGGAPLPTYSYAAVRDLVRKHIGNTPAEQPELPDTADAAPNAVSSLIDEETARMVKDAIAAVPVSVREMEEKPMRRRPIRRAVRRGGRSFRRPRAPCRFAERCRGLLSRGTRRSRSA
jgi:hypothetical protein